MSRVVTNRESFISKWMAAGRLVAELDSDLRKAKAALQNAEMQVIRDLLLPDAKPGEKYCLWFGDSVIEVTKGDGQPGSSEGYIQIRKLGESLKNL